jgi:hypothetical protein
VTDATVIPRGGVRLRLLTEWTRYDELFGVPGVASGRTAQLAAGLATDSLGPREISALSSTETAVRAASGLTGFRLTAGKLVATANSRVVTSPLVAEYGLTSRLTVGLMVPLVQTRTTVFAALNPDTGFANVGPNPALLAADARTANAALVDRIRLAAAALLDRSVQCRVNPTRDECLPINGQDAAIQSLIQSSNTLAGAIESLYGTSANSPGQLFVPLTGTPADRAIGARIAKLDTSYRAFLGASVVTGSVAAAQGPAALEQLQSLVSSDVLGIGRDTIATTSRTSIGDISIAAALQLMNTFGDSTATRRVRVVVNGAIRFGTGQPAATNRLFDIGTGYGQTGVEAGGAEDVQLSERFMLTGVGRYILQLGTIDVARVANPANSPVPLALYGSGTYSAGNVLSVLAVPRFRLAPSLSLNGFYSLRRVGADRYTTTTVINAASGGVTIADSERGASAATEHQGGVGFAYSTVMERDRAPGRLPFEVAFSHVETLRATGGPVAKSFRDQIELRVYLFGQRRQPSLTK